MLSLSNFDIANYYLMVNDILRSNCMVSRLTKGPHAGVCSSMGFCIWDTPVARPDHEVPIDVGNVRTYTPSWK